MISLLRYQATGGKVALLLVCSLFSSCIWIFLELATDVGQYQQRDERIMRWFRQAGNPGQPVGPPWLADAMRDASALGSEVVLSLFAAGSVGYLLLAGAWRRATLVAVAAGGGGWLNALLKDIAERPRPQIVPHLTEVSSSSFPSGHSMASAIVYLTLGLLLARAVQRRRLRVYVVGLALAVTFLVGVSRVFLGVHYPTDVIAGWAAGTAWALLFCAADVLVGGRPSTPASKTVVKSA